MRTPSSTPVFVTYSPDTEEVSVNGERLAVGKALSAAQREASMQTFLHINIAVEKAVRGLGHVLQQPAPAEQDHGIWEVFAEATVGYERMVKMRATESQQYNILGNEFQIPAGYILGWIMVTPQNLKGVRDRTLFVCEKSMLFGVATQRVCIKDGSVIGRVKNSVIESSAVGFCELDGCRILHSSVEFCALDSVKVLHSIVRSSFGRRALLSSCSVNSFTVVDSQLTDVQGSMVGLNHSTVSSKALHNVRRSEFNEAGNGEKVEASFDSVILIELSRILIDGERLGAVSHLRESLLRSPVLQKSKMLVAIEEAPQGDRSSWEAKPRDGGRVVLEVSGDKGSPARVQSIQGSVSEVPLMNAPKTEGKKPSTAYQEDEDEDLDDSDIEDGEYLKGNV